MYQTCFGKVQKTGQSLGSCCFGSCVAPHGGISRLNNGRLRIFCLFVKQLFRFCAAATVVVSTTATTAAAAEY